MVPTEDYPYPPSNMIRLQDHVDAMFREKEKALDAVARERDRAAEVLRETTAAAAVMRTSAEKSQQEAYDRLDEKVAGLKETAELRDEKNNEFREQLSDQATRFMPRTEFDVAHAAMTIQIGNL